MQNAEFRMQNKAPSERELAPKVTEGACACLLLSLLVPLSALSLGQLNREDGNLLTKPLFTSIMNLKWYYSFSDKVRRRLHDRITKRGYSNEKVEEILRKMLGLD